MKTVVVDCQNIRSKSEFWALYVNVVRPKGAEMFGRNLDAFWDAIEAAGPGCPKQDEVHFTHSEQLKSIDSGAFLEALRKIARESQRKTRIILE